jgi:hypothetical protein
MGKKASQTSDAGGVQVFELTMDNPEDQDELNRRFRKPGEPNRGPLLKPTCRRPNPLNAESSGKKKRKR